MKLSDFDFDLPDHLIATRPAVPRSSARLLVSDGVEIHDQRVTDLTSWLRRGDRLVLNDTRVIPARLFGMRVRNSVQGRVEAKIEVTLLEPRSDGTWSALIKPLRKLKPGETVIFADDLHARLEKIEEGQGHLRFNCKGDAFDTALEAAGAMPLPPYIAAKRAADARDKTDYQTVWAKTAGAVAAPTASLHFDETLLQGLSDLGVGFTYVTLHVGAGTFLPVKVDDISDHKMHSEWGQVSGKAAAEIAATKAAGGRVIPVGTTALRLIETAAHATGQITAWEGDTDIFITPGFSFHVADALMTNLHLPKSTLMMLVAAFMGQDQIKRVYEHAVAHGYRFFSYGDASLLIPHTALERS
ncbi:tRNA preQ1(34) S-adenosylmethionine ribosyltransferase-isomerase QueA [Sulfitobacter sp. F26204]|uniref:tRNA preQ1(34) S-adenosylmethionine ribosyltransferase-isomerase QueA n=1 Tax=Sulfitobacter sp. F26204 TaxID=2996014 RepID=UPI00225E5B4B|nr:tRNA preQ1(34) S-adenosylmethionine ribosyltransferase-isomerase QueA [Sulfitobacter sp. F26204]MCX7560053.1 tRNA preQ1(34) S-adenosylmethionine ribosyltransferase-isomerase QueA [Sulfitobacter sp. F26204]